MIRDDRNPDGYPVGTMYVERRTAADDEEADMAWRWTGQEWESVTPPPRSADPDPEPSRD